MFATLCAIESVVAMNSSDSDSELGLNENFSGHADNLTNSFDNII